MQGLAYFSSYVPLEDCNVKQLGCQLEDGWIAGCCYCFISPLPFLFLYSEGKSLICNLHAGFKRLFAPSAAYTAVIFLSFRNEIWYSNVAMF